MSSLPATAPVLGLRAPRRSRARLTLTLKWGPDEVFPDNHCDQAMTGVSIFATVGDCDRKKVPRKLSKTVFQGTFHIPEIEELRTSGNFSGTAK